jgi:BCCT family betaine/carnitine transporter
MAFELKHSFKDVNHKIGQNNTLIFGLDINAPVFMTSGLIVIIFMGLVLMFPNYLSKKLAILDSFLIHDLELLFSMGVNFFTLFCIYLVFSKMGNIRIGGKDAKTDHSTVAWLSMLFTSGVGIGIMFFGVLEPSYHFQNTPLGITGISQDEQKIIGLAATMFHWGIHPWSIYAVVSLSLAFLYHNHNLPMSFRSAFYPILGNKIWGWRGHIIDILAVLATLFGLSASLGYGADQAMTGISYVYGIENNNISKIVIISTVTIFALISVMMGVNKGLKRLSLTNLLSGIAFFFMFGMIYIDNHSTVILDIFRGMGAYMQNIFAFSSPIDRDPKFFNDWTVFYWAWWIAWAPFVGMFVASISKGRTVRELLVYSILVPSLICIIWMSVFGGTAINQYLDTGYTGVMDAIIAGEREIPLFKMLETMPDAQITSIVSVVLLFISFVTSSDSGSMVADTITAGGKIKTPVIQHIFWCSLEGGIAIVLLIGGGLSALHSSTMALSLPIILLMFAMCYAILISLRSEYNKNYR